MKSKVSVIIPVYNTSKYLKSCIESVINQTYKNLEIIIINDESSDNSEDICKYYSKIDKRIVFINNIINKGVSYTRNKGIKLSTGKYIVFVDSDDLVSTSHIYDMINLIKKEKTEICITKTNYLRQNIIQKHELIINKKISIDEITNNWKLFLNPAVCCWIHNKLFISKIIKNNNIYFNNNLTLGEDKLFCLEYFKHCSAISINNKYTYTYNRTNDYSITRTALNEHAKSIKLIKDNLYSFMIFQNKLDKSSLYTHIYDLVCYGNDKIIESKKINKLYKYKYVTKNIKQNINKDTLYYNKNRINKIDYILIKFKMFLLYFALIVRRKNYGKV